MLALTLGVVVLGCLITPPLYSLGQWAIEIDLIPQLRGFKLDRYLRRGLLIAFVILAWPFFKWLGISGWGELGIKKNQIFWRDLGVGAAVGLLGLWAVGLCKVGMGDAQFRDAFPWRRMGAALGAGLVVPWIEEPIFRGVILGAARRRLRWPTALAVTSVFFAAVHFVHKPRKGSPLPQEVDWLSGFEIFPAMLWQFAEPSRIVAQFITLFLVGLLLGYLVIRTQSFALAVGLHGGWVLALKVFDFYTRGHQKSIWFGKSLLEGMAPAILVVMSFLVLLWYLRKRAPTVAGR